MFGLILYIVLISSTFSSEYGVVTSTKNPTIEFQRLGPYSTKEQCETAREKIERETAEIIIIGTCIAIVN